MALSEYSALFWITAIGAVLLIGIAKAGFGGGVGVVATPLLALTMTVSEAAALLLPLLIATDIVNVYRYWSEVDWKITKSLLPAGLIGVVLGSIFFNTVSDNERLFKIFIGIVALAFVVFQLSRRLILGKLEQHEFPLTIRSILGIAAGFGSTVAHIGGPPMTIFMLPKKLPRRVYVATFLMFFFVINLVKLIPYGYLGLLEVGNIPLFFALLPIVYIGIRLGIWLNGRLSEEYFQIAIYVLLSVTGTQLILGRSLISILTS